MDYYSILGVSREAPDFVIQAAYRAMAKKYHPDTYKGSKKEAERKIREINEAYSTLSSQQLRKKYDASLGKKDATKAEEFSEKDFWDIKIPDCEVVEQYYPDIEESRAKLSKLSDEISILFQILIVENKEYERADFFADQLKSYYLTKYFGEDELAHRFAEYLLQNDLKKVALELNRDIRVLGSKQSKKIVGKLKRKFFKELYGQSPEELEEWADYFDEYFREHEFETEKDLTLGFRRVLDARSLIFETSVEIFCKEQRAFKRSVEVSVVRFTFDLLAATVTSSYPVSGSLHYTSDTKEYLTDIEAFNFIENEIQKIL